MEPTVYKNNTGKTACKISDASLCLCSGKHTAVFESLSRFTSFFLKYAGRRMIEVLEIIDGSSDGEIHLTFASTISPISFVFLSFFLNFKSIVGMQYYVSFRYKA